MIVGQSDNRYDQMLNFTHNFKIDKEQNCLNFLWNLIKFHVRWAHLLPFYFLL